MARLKFLLLLLVFAIYSVGCNAPIESLDSLETVVSLPTLQPSVVRTVQLTEGYVLTLNAGISDAVLTELENSAETNAIIALNQPIPPETSEQLGIGGVALGEALSDDVYLVSIGNGGKETLERFVGAGRIASVSLLPIGVKIDPNLSSNDGAVSFAISVTLFAAADPAQREALDSLMTIIEISESGEIVVRGSAESQNLPAIASLNFVRRIEAGAP